ncbi:kinase-like domain-containing protein [Lophiotrema nucula]|uniref:Kinase-like domain-containing protein n=1 Tax=Lophiotrema nucula TaxID=690887 RepID=A0A6A5ZXM3_9PLEO|nr:kinase-like domain-containing protein [Lophiotrema nucula]
MSNMQHSIIPVTAGPGRTQTASHSRTGNPQKEMKWYRNCKEFRQFAKDPGTSWFPLTYMPSSLVPFQFVGCGEFGTVFFCLPKFQFNVSREQLANGKSVNITGLKKAIVALKVPYPGLEADLAEEVSMLAAIKKDPNDDHHCQTIRQNFRVPDDPKCSRAMATNAIVGAMSLGDVVRSFGQSNAIAPEELVWHVFLQLSDALLFLHRNKPAIVHRDLMPDNILVDCFKQDIAGFPNIVLIDFGCAEYENNLFNGEFLADAEYFCRLLHSLRGRNKSMCPAEEAIIHNSQDFGKMRQISGHCNEGCYHTEEWLDFVEALHDNVGDLADQQVDAEYVKYDVEQLRTRFEKMALFNRRSAPRNVLRVIKERIFAVAFQREGKTMQLLKKALES